MLFVGEALVGNDGVDQLRKFNQALADHSDVNDPHLIDGIVLTKFDTIDDKVCNILGRNTGVLFEYRHHCHLNHYRHQLQIYNLKTSFFRSEFISP